jgi:Tfp pilus assembly major pilin PilA
MIVIAIIGILAAIALPAYAKYMARARFTEVTSAVSGVQKQVELCIFDLGTTGFVAGDPVTVDVSVNGNGCANTLAGDNSGNGWRIDAGQNYGTKFIDNIMVNANGVITAQAITGSGLADSTGAAGATIEFRPHYGAANNGVVDWRRVDASSTCIDVDLC